jgi:hypothetical protein
VRYSTEEAFLPYSCLVHVAVLPSGYNSSTVSGAVVKKEYCTLKLLAGKPLRRILIASVFISD